VLKDCPGKQGLGSCPPHLEGNSPTAFLLHEPCPQRKQGFWANPAPVMSSCCSLFIMYYLCLYIMYIIYEHIHIQISCTHTPFQQHGEGGSQQSGSDYPTFYRIPEKGKEFPKVRQLFNWLALIHTCLA
jgi:hypothetical protein